jgi:hypothetical protein
VGQQLAVGKLIYHGFHSLHAADRKMVIWDDGKGKFSCTTLENTALALRNVLLKPAETANRLARVSDFAVSQVELLEAIECLSGEKWTTETVSSEAVIKDANERLAEGDVFGVQADRDRVRYWCLWWLFGGGWSVG